jgi:hypothetical protein
MVKIFSHVRIRNSIFILTYVVMVLPENPLLIICANGLPKLLVHKAWYIFRDAETTKTVRNFLKQIAGVDRNVYDYVNYERGLFPELRTIDAESRNHLQVQDRRRLSRFLKCLRRKQAIN